MTSAIAFIGFRIGLIPPDNDHPYGHGKAEPLMGLAIVVFLLIVAYEIFSQAYIKMTMGVALTPPSLLAAIMAIIGIGTNYLLTSYSMNIGKQINSPAIIADANHQKVDIFSCFAILVGVIGSQFGYPFLDPLVAVFIAFIIIKTAFGIARDNVNVLMGKLPSETILDEVKSAANKVKDVKGVHSVKINPMGPYSSAELHIEVDGELKLKDAHEIAHNVEKQIINDVYAIKMAIIHVCPFEEECATD